MVCNELNELFQNSDGLTDFSVVEAPNETEQKYQSLARKEMAKHGLKPLAYICKSNHPDSRKWDRIGGCCLWGADDPTPVVFLNGMSLQILEENKREYIGLHEIAHALIGPDKGHGEEWLQTALRLGDGLVLADNQLYTENGYRQCAKNRGELAVTRG